MSELLAQRILRLEDRIEIEHLVSRYGRAIDDRDWEVIQSLYSDDSIFDTVSGRILGNSAIRKYYEGRLAMFGPTYHYPHSHEIYFDDSKTVSNAATGIVCAHAELAIKGETTWIALRYHDQYQRTESGWKFQERIVKVYYVLPLAELPHRLADKNRNNWPDTIAKAPDIGSHL